ncbi:hypothetical protein RhiJN_20004 [Ceratobasidium sp. AG-Ba]|nr:hypothetical protein RhiJN_20004 [Ceratobasidium sp. AG-Ba]
MFFLQIARFFLFAAHLQNGLLSFYGYGSSVDLCAATSMYIVANAATDTLPSVYQFAKTNAVGFKVQSSLAPTWLRGVWHDPGLELADFQFLVNPFRFFGFGERTSPSPYAKVWLDEDTPTSSLSANTPVRAFNAGLSTSTPTTRPTPLAAPYQLESSMVPDELETVLYAAPSPSPLVSSPPLLPDVWAINGPSPSPRIGDPPAHTPGVSTPVREVVPPPLLSSAGVDCPVAAPIPTVAASGPLVEETEHGLLNGLGHPETHGSAWFGTAWGFGHGWISSLAVSIAVQVLVTAYLYPLRNETQVNFMCITPVIFPASYR